MIGALATLALLSGLYHPSGAAPRHAVQVEHYRVGRWRLDVRRDRFLYQTTCSIRRDRVEYRHGVVAFEFGPGVNTANAIFRIDDAAPQGVGSVAVQAAGLGAALSGPSLHNPSGGRVYIPADKLTDARKVAIRPNAQSWHQTFDLTGLSKAVDVAKAKNCDAL